MTTENDPTPETDAEQPKAVDTASLDTEALLADPTGPVELSWDVLNEDTWEYETVSFAVVVRRIQMIQLMKLLKIITSGLGSRLDLIDFDTEDMASSIGSLVAATALAIPDAVPETIAFVRSMVELVPDTSDFQPGNNKHAIAANADNVKEQRARFEEAFKNPDLDALFAIVERVVTVEGPHLVALGKKLVDLLARQRPQRS